MELPVVPFREWRHGACSAQSLAHSKGIRVLGTAVIILEGVLLAWFAQGSTASDLFLSK